MVKFLVIPFSQVSSGLMKPEADKRSPEAVGSWPKEVGSRISELLGGQCSSLTEVLGWKAREVLGIGGDTILCRDAQE